MLEILDKLHDLSWNDVEMSGYHQLQPLLSLIVCIFLIMNTSTKVVDGLFIGGEHL